MAVFIFSKGKWHLIATKRNVMDERPDSTPNKAPDATTVVAIQRDFIELLRKWMGFLLNWLLHHLLPSFEDSLLAINTIRRLVRWTAAPEIKPIILKHVQRYTATGTFNVKPYYVRFHIIHACCCVPLHIITTPHLPHHQYTPCTRPNTLSDQRGRPKTAPPCCFARNDMGWR